MRVVHHCLYHSKLLFSRDALHCPHPHCDVMAAVWLPAFQTALLLTSLTHVCDSLFHLNISQHDTWKFTEVFRKNLVTVYLNRNINVAQNSSSPKWKVKNVKSLFSKLWPDFCGILLRDFMSCVMFCYGAIIATAGTIMPFWWSGRFWTNSVQC